MIVPMKSLLYPIALCILAAGCLYLAFAQSDNKPQPTAPFRHVVFFKFNDSATDSQVAKVEREFAALSGKIDGITDFEWGASESVEKLNEGFTHCFLVSFKKKSDLEAYLVHPDHLAFKKLLKDVLDKAFVFDYTAGKPS